MDGVGIERTLRPVPSLDFPCALFPPDVFKSAFICAICGKKLFSYSAQTIGKRLCDDQDFTTWEEQRKKFFPQIAQICADSGKRSCHKKARRFTKMMLGGILSREQDFRLFLWPLSSLRGLGSGNSLIQDEVFKKLIDSV